MANCSLPRDEMLLRSNGVERSIRTPQYGYDFEIRMSMRQSDLRGDGLKGWCDNGRQYDSRVCSLPLTNPAEKQVLLERFLANDSEGRGNEIQLVVPKGVMPFGPDLGDGRKSYQVRVLDESFTGAKKSPYLNFQSSIQLALIETARYKIPTTPHGLNTLKIGEVDFLRFPDGWISPTTLRGVNTILTQGLTAHALDRGQGADRFVSSFTVLNNPDKIAKLLYYLTWKARGVDFEVKSEKNTYLFGADNSNASGAGLHDVRLESNVVRGSHTRYNQFSVDIALQMVRNKS